MDELQNTSNQYNLIDIFRTFYPTKNIHSSQVHMVYLPQNKISINLKVFKSYKKHSLTVVQFTLEIKTKDF